MDNVFLVIWLYVSLGATGVVFVAKPGATRWEKLGLFLTMPAILMIFSIPFLLEGLELGHDD